MSGFKEVSFSGGTTLFKAGDSATNLYILQSGTIDLSDGTSGHVFAQLGPGDTFGEQAVLAGGVRSATATAATDCLCLELNSSGLNAILSAESPMSNLVFKALHLQLFMQNAVNRAR